jgi:hypothetical protein
VALGAALVLGGIGIGYLAFGGGDEYEPEAAATTVTEADDADEPSIDDLGDGDLSDFLPDDFDELFSDGLPDIDELFPDGLPDMSDLLEGDGGPFAMGGVQVTLVFENGATSRQTEAVRAAWDDADLLSGVIYLDGDDLEGFLDGTGGPVPPGAAPSTVSAFGSEDDAEEVRDFVCAFDDDPGVLTVVLSGARACDQSL